MLRLVIAEKYDDFVRYMEEMAERIPYADKCVICINQDLKETKNP